MTLTHLSYSQYKTYTSCPRSWYLGKVREAEEKQTWYIPIGKAVHEMIEARLKGEPDKEAEEFFYPLILRQMEIEPDLHKWLAGGPTNSPVTEEKALEKVKVCFSSAIDFLEEIDVWEVEYDASGSLPGLEVPLKAYIDLLGEHKKHGPLIVDWKTGSSKDKFQLETYRALLRVHELKCKDLAGYISGLFVMLDPGVSNARKIDLSKVNPGAVGEKYQKVYDQMKAKVYKTQAQFMCKYCFHQDNCLLVAGPTARAQYYDKAEEDGLPF